MKKAPKLTDAERSEIRILLNKGYSHRSIGEVLDRGHNTISDEIKRNSVNGQYIVASAKRKAYLRRKYAKYQGKKIQENQALREYVIRGLKARWNPDEISGQMKATNQPFYASKTSIYEWLRSEWGQAYCELLYTKRHRVRKHKPKPEKQMIPDRVGIEQRPEEVEARVRVGHWEGDTVVSGKKTGSKAALVVTVERSTRLVAAQKIPNLKPESFNKAIRHVQQRVTKMKSLTLDNGIENRHHALLAVPVYFCDPYSSWQKGSVENVNKMIRHYLPKGMDLAEVTPRQLQDIIWIINNKPRKILGYKSALEMAREKGLLRWRVS